MRMSGIQAYSPAQSVSFQGGRSVAAEVARAKAEKAAQAAKDMYFNQIAEALVGSNGEGRDELIKMANLSQQSV